MSRGNRDALLLAECAAQGIDVAPKVQIKLAAVSLPVRVSIFGPIRLALSAAASSSRRAPTSVPISGSYQQIAHTTATKSSSVRLSGQFTVTNRGARVRPAARRRKRLTSVAALHISRHCGARTFL
jgi:hypothetical protein